MCFSALNSSETSSSPQSVSIDVPNDRILKRSIHSYVKSNFPYLSTSADNKETLSAIVVSPSETPFVLVKLGLDPSDAKDLYIYMKCGPTPDTCMYIGENLNKSQRTEVFRYMQKLHRQIDSKTICVGDKVSGLDTWFCLHVFLPL